MEVAMLSQIDVNILRLLALGVGTKEIANTIGLDFKQFNSQYASLLSKTKCWDEMALGLWWQKNQHKYLALLPDNLVAFDFTKLNN